MPLFGFQLIRDVLWSGQQRCFLRSCLVVPCLIVLAACESAPRSDDAASDASPGPAPEPLQTALLGSESEERYRRMIADWLYDGLRALSDDRLLTPAEASAHAYFSRVLALEPDNEIARDGLQDIVDRYAQLADIASRQGQFDNAEMFLRRGEQINADHASIADSRSLLAQERERTVGVYTIDGRSVANRDETALETLREIASRIADDSSELFVLITAPSDEQGRWMFTQIRDALAEPRLRGDIEIGSQPSVRILNPPA